ncbi:MAG TPA: DNA translocase FtsK [Actinomycetota bacterium]|nr:DNA translocase FtsK [Actinomycetota bacterium]
MLFVAILMGLSLAGAAGPVGYWVAWTLRGGFGKISYLIPFATLVVSVAAFVRREEAGRILVGSTLISAASAGLGHLIAGTPRLDGGYAGLASGGGALGALVAVPLRTYIGTWAGALACVFAGTLGVLIVTKTPLRRAVQTAWIWVWTGIIGIAKVVWAAARFLAGVASIRREKPETGEESEAARTPIDEKDLPALEESLASDLEEFNVTADLTDLTPEAPAALPPKRVTISREPVNPKQATLDLKLPEASSYRLPPVTLFRRSSATGRAGRGAEEVARVLERTLREFGVDAAVAAMTRGPTVTRFEVELAAGVKVSQVLRLADDIAYALGSPDVRLIAPIPGKSAIGVEVPNRDRELVLVGDVVQSSVWDDERHPLVCALGKGDSGQPVVINLAEMPHLLIAGATGAGKSSCLNALISSLLARARPDQVRLVLIDPKMVELSHFADLPHLASPVVTHPKRAAETLGWVVREMERRYELLSSVGQRNIDFYNEAVRTGQVPPDPGGGEPEDLPYIVVFIDELADLMMVAARQVEDSICRIAQMARAVGIHLVAATQRPSVDVVTGLIKANIPSRIAFAVASQADSRVVLDMGGADKLVGHGDMLYLPTGTSKPRRVQGAYVTEKELEELTSFIRAQAEPVYAKDALEAATADEDGMSDEDGDPLLEEAMELVVRAQMGSTSMLQRKLRVGFSRAGRLMDLLERRGVVGPQEGSKARAVLITPDELDERSERAGRLPSEY